MRGRSSHDGERISEAGIRCPEGEATVRCRGTAVTILLFIVLLVGIPSEECRARDALASESYVFGVVPQFEQRKLYAIWGPVISELMKRTGLNIKLVTTLSIRDFEKKFVAGGFDFAYMNPYYMVKSNNPEGYIPLVRDKTPLRGILVVRKDGPFRKIADLDGKVVAFPSPNAIGATLLIRADLERLHHVRVEPLYVKTHSSVYLHVAKGITAAGGGVEKSWLEQDQAVRDALRIIYTTRDMPSHPIAAHPRVGKDLRGKVRQALLDMDNTPEGRALLSRIPVKEFTPASTDDYREMLGWGLERYWDAFWTGD